MPRTPNYDFERKERDRAKAAKKAERLASKTDKKESDQADEVIPETEGRRAGTGD